MEPSDIRKRVIAALDHARREAAAHREEAAEATRAFEALLPVVSATWRVAANVLKAEGHGFKVHSPAGSLRFASERSAEDFVELTLDTTRRPVAVVGRTGLARGHRVIDRETIVAQGDQILALTDEAALRFLLTELEPFIER